MLEVHNCTRRFSTIQALSDVSFAVHSGEIFGLLGPNGAGKTTLIHIIAMIDTADGGTVTVNGMDTRRQPTKIRPLVGLVPQEPGFYAALSARENLEFWGTMYGVGRNILSSRIADLLEVTGLSNRANEPVSRFSGGMRRRLNLALGLVHHPSLILLDEPTLEVDPQSRRQIVDFIRGLAQEGSTVIYTTHQLSDAQEVCNRLGIMDQGKIIAQGTLTELREHLPACSTLCVEFDDTVDDALAAALMGPLPGAGAIAVKGSTVRIEVKDLRTLMSSVAEVVAMPGVTGFRMEEASLENIFLHLTGRGMRD